MAPLWPLIYFIFLFHRMLSNSKVTSKVLEAPFKNDLLDSPLVKTHKIGQHVSFLVNFCDMNTKTDEFSQNIFQKGGNWN